MILRAVDGASVCGPIAFGGKPSPFISRRAKTILKSAVVWNGSRRIIRSLYPPIDLFEDIADPEDWPLLIAAEQKTNPLLMGTLGALDLVPPDRRASTVVSQFEF